MIRTRRPSNRRARRPLLELLEGRTLLTSYNAANVNDLIQDINLSNTSGGTNNITLTAATSSPYALTTVNNTTDGPTGLPVIASGNNLTIKGSGDTIERSTGTFRLFDVAAGATLNLQNMTLANGSASGSGVAAEGGAIYSKGTLSLSQVTVENNKAVGINGGAGAAGSVGGAGAAALGGGLYIAGGTANLSSVTFSSNTAQGGNGGAGGAQSSSLSAGPGGAGGSGSGGALYVAQSTTATLTNDSFTGNAATGGAAGAGGSSPDFGGAGGTGGVGAGGVMYVAGTVSDTSGDSFTSNSAQGGVGGNGSAAGAGGAGGAASGGVLYVTPTGNATLSNGTLSKNSVRGGLGGNGNVFHGLDGRAGRGGVGSGGGIYVGGGTFTLTSETLSGNLAQGGNGGPGANGGQGTGGTHGAGGTGGAGSGGAVYLAGGTVTLASDPFTGNTARGGNGGDGGYATSVRGGAGGAGGAASGGGLYIAAGSISLSGESLSSNKAQGGDAGDGGAAGNSRQNPGDGGAGGAGSGGGIYMAGGTLGLASETLSGDSVQGGSGGQQGGMQLPNGRGSGGNGGAALGGVLYVAAGTASLTSDNVSGNFAQGGTSGAGTGGNGGVGGAGSGGVVYVFGGTANLTNDSFATNKAVGGTGALGSTGAGSGNGGPGSGGVLYLAPSGVAILTGDTLAGNTAQGGAGGAGVNYGGAGGAGTGGGVYVAGGTATLTNDTFSSDIGQGAKGGFASDTTLGGGGPGGNGSGGGLFVAVGTANVTNNTFSGNQALAGAAGGGVFPGPAGTASGGGISNASQGTTTLTNTIVAASTGGDIKNAGTLKGSFNLIQDGSGGLANTKTGNPLLSSLGNYGGPTQTMVPLPGSPVLGAGIAVSGLTTDQRGQIRGNLIDIGAVQASLVVESTAGSVDTGVPTLTLPGAVNLVDQFAGDTITFDPTVFNPAATITLTGSTLNLSNTALTTTITGPAAGVTISGAGKAQVFSIGKGATASLSGMTITGGYAEFGGGLENMGTATLSDVAFSGNFADFGGGLDNIGTATLSDCTVSGNSGSFGSGLYNKGTATLTDVTVSGNGNSASYGGGLDNNGTATLTDTIVAGNGGGDIQGTGNVGGSSSYNLIGTGGSGGLSNGVNHNIVLSGAQTAGLAPLGNYGGPTQTMALLPGSLAIGAGIGQRRHHRPARRPRATSGAVDIGAFQNQGYTVAASSGSGQSTNVNTAFPNPLMAILTENFAHAPIPGASLTFTAPASGASAALSASSALTNTNGQASVTATANATGGSYTVAASATGIANPAAFTLTNVATASVTLVRSSPANVSYGAGSVIDITVAWSKSVVVTGSPQLALNSGGIATYSSGSGTSTLTFVYTVAAGQYVKYLDTSSTSALTLNGGTIDDTANTPAVLTLPAPGSSNSLSFSKVIVDATAPDVAAVSSTTANGSYGVGSVITVLLGWTKPVVVTGSPKLALNSGGTPAYATGSGTSTLVFVYTVAAGQNANPLDEASASALSLNGGTILDTVPNNPNAAVLTLPAPGAAGSLGKNKAIVVDTTAPSVTTVRSTPQGVSYGVGSVINVTVNWSENVVVTGSPELALNSGGTATYSSGSGSGTLTFTYTVATGQNADFLNYTSTSALILNGGTIDDTVGTNPNAAVLTLPATSLNNALLFSRIVVDTTAPVVTGVSSTTANGTYGVGAVIDITVGWSKPVVVTGTPELALNSGGMATYNTGSGTSTLTFIYTVAAGQSANPLDEAAASALTLNGGTILDTVQTNPNAAILTLPAPGDAGSLGQNKSIVISTAATGVTSVSSTTAAGTYGVGSVITITVGWSQPVVVTGMPELSLNSGGKATYTSGSGTSTLTFTYTVADGQDADPLDEASTSALTLNGGTIDDASSNPATLTLPAPGSANSLSKSNIVIDTTAPTILAYDVVFGSKNLTYNLIGSTRFDLPWQITGIKVVFSKPITTADANSLTGLSTSGLSGLGTNTLTWSINTISLGTFSTTLLNTGAGCHQGRRREHPRRAVRSDFKVLYGDFNGDGVVSSADFLGVYYATSQPYNIFADLNGDGVVDATDTQIARSQIGKKL